MSEASAPARGEDTSKLLKRAAKGDPSCLPHIRALLADEERGAHVVDLFGSAAQWLEADLTNQAAGQDLLIQEATKKKLAQLRAELSGPNPTPIERLLAERAAVCWFLVNRYESIAAKAQDVSFRQAAYYQDRIDRAHKRLLTALKTLATIRKLAVPSIQVNIGKSQTNIANVPGGKCSRAT